MQITEKLRSEIALALPKLGLEEANEIARQCGYSNDTVYREWRKIHGRVAGKSLVSNPVVVALAELAAKRTAEAKALDKRLKKSMRQLSAA